jgi:hypothetical protein
VPGAHYLTVVEWSDCAGSGQPVERLEAALAEGFGLLDELTDARPAAGDEPFNARVDAVLATLWRAELLVAGLGFEPAVPPPDPPTASCAGRAGPRRRCAALRAER